MPGTLLSIQVGQPRIMCMTHRLDERHETWESGIFKDPIQGIVWAGKLNLTGDGQADLDNHGGPDNVILAYDAAHYPVWRKILDLPNLSYGGFGENFTVEGFSDDTVCIGDTWRIGDVLLQVTQPRQPCYKLARRLERKQVVKEVVVRGWGGWYLRVLQEGSVSAGMPIELIERLHPDWPIRTAAFTMYNRLINPAPAAALATLPELSTRWKVELIEE